MEVTSVNNASSQSAMSTLNQDFDQFLLLLTTQMQHQDPLSPMDSTEFTNQLVAFSGVEQQIKMNDQLETLIAFQTLNLTAVGLGFIGKNVEVIGSDFHHNGTDGATFGYSMPADMAKATLTIKNSDGETVFSTEAEKGAGVHKYIWDGKDSNGITVPAGMYEMTISAMDADEQSYNITTTVPGYVEGLESAADGNLFLIINGNQVPIGNVNKVTLPTSAPETPQNDDNNDQDEA